MTTRLQLNSNKYVMINNITLILMILGAALSRLIPHPWNFTAIGAMALFGGASIKSKFQSLLIPVAALFLSDLILGFHSTMFFVYLPVAVTVILGWTLQESKNRGQLITASLFTSALFFAISNLGVWLTSGLYASNWQGFVDCYVAALPFLDRQVLGDLFFTGVLFGSFEFIKKVAPQFLGLPVKANQ